MNNCARISPSRSGFTLLELSIVLVIIGLLAGGILVGRDLIHAAELRSVVSDVDKFTAAANTFRLKYNCIPGDCTNATDYWGTDPGGCPDTPGNSVPKTATCNGTGNGRLADSSDVAINTGYACEALRF